MQKLSYTLLIVLFSFLGTHAQKEKKPKLLAGPVIGAVTQNSAKIWIAYRGQGKNMLVLGDTAEKKIHYPTYVDYINNSKGAIALTMEFTDLKPDHLYNIIVSIDGWGAHARYSFRTPADSAVKDFDFLLGSCSLMQTDVTRSLFPGSSTLIFHYMKKRKGDFMVWLGDNVYYIYRRHWSSYEGMFNRNLKIRKSYNHLYRELLGNVPNYAMWDDHDYGPNDADKTFALKDTSLMVFKHFWPNSYPQTSNFNGNFFSFRKYDAEFFMTDGRYYRDSPRDSGAAMLGNKQMLWLKNKLMFSDATFKFICLGTQILTANPFGETYLDYASEREDLLNFISDNNITGVIFLTGDKHFSEISKLDWKGYPMHDVTCSPLTSPPLPRKLLGAYYNDNRIPKTDYPLKNFGKIRITGPVDDRKATVQFYGRSGVKRREFVVSANELKRK